MSENTAIFWYFRKSNCKAWPLDTILIQPIHEVITTTHTVQTTGVHPSVSQSTKKDSEYQHGVSWWCSTDELWSPIQILCACCQVFSLSGLSNGVIANFRTNSSSLFEWQLGHLTCGCRHEHISVFFLFIFLSLFVTKWMPNNSN